MQQQQQARERGKAELPVREVWLRVVPRAGKAAGQGVGAKARAAGAVGAEGAGSSGISHRGREMYLKVDPLCGGRLQFTI